MAGGQVANVPQIIRRPNFNATESKIFSSDLKLKQKLSISDELK
jgi:hypothetical protein